MRRERRGKWAGLTAVKISKLLGCGVTTTKKLLYAIKKKQQDITEEDIGKLIYEYKLAKHIKNLEKYLR